MRQLYLLTFLFMISAIISGCHDGINDEPTEVTRYFDRYNSETHYSISSMVVLNTGTILFAGMDAQKNCNIYLLNPETKEIRTVKQDELKQIDSTIEEIFSSENHRIWKGKNFLLRYNDQSQTNLNWRVRHLWNVSDIRSTASSQIKIDQQGNIWIAEQIEKGIRMFDGHEWHTYLEEDVFMYVSVDRNNNIYASTLPLSEEKGILLRYDHTKWDTVYTCKEFNHWVTGVDFDNDGNIWFGILFRAHIGINHGGGLTKFDGEGFEVFTNSNSDIPGNSVIDVFVNQKNDIWVGTYNAGFAKYTSNKTWEHYTDIYLINYDIENITEASDDYLYFTIKSFGVCRLKL